MPGELFQNFYASAFGELISTALAGVIQAKFSRRKAFQITFSTAVTGSLIIILIGDKRPELMPLLVLFTKVGINSAYIFSWFAPIGMFPTMF